MKKKFLQIVSMVLIIAMVLPTTAFAAETVSLKVSESTKLTVSFTATQNATIKWSSSDTSIATVTVRDSDNREATVNGVAAGTATIKAERIQYGSVTNTETFNVVVTADAAAGSGADGTFGGTGEEDGNENETPMVPGTPETPETPDTPVEPDATKLTVTIADSKIYDGGDKNTTTVKLEVNGKIDESDITWYSTDKSVAKVSGSGKTATVTGVSAGEASIKVLCGDLTSNSVDVKVEHREIIDFKVEETKKIDKHYYTGQSFDREGIKVSIKYNDNNEWQETTSYAITPSGAFTEAGDNVKVTISYPGTTFTKDIYVAVEQIEVESVEITSPKNNAEVEKGKSIDSVSVKVTYNNGDDETITMTKADAKGVSLTGYTLGNNITADMSFTATYGGKTSAPVLVKVKAITKTVSDMYVYTKPTKLTYKVNDTLDLSGLVLAVRYTDDNTKYFKKDYSANSSKIKANVSKFTKQGTQTVTLTYTDEFGSATTTFDVTVGTVVDVEGIANTSSYKPVLEKDAKVKIGDELDWEDLFDYVYIKYTESGKAKYKKIVDDDALEDWLGSGAKLSLIVSGKDDDSKADTVEEDDVEDGEVTLKLCLDYANETYSLRFEMKVSDVSCTVTVYRSNGTTKIGGSKTFDNLKEALEYLEDKEDIIDDFDISSSYKSNFIIKIKLGEDQDLAKFEFAPDHEQEMVIDLNGCTLKLKSEWIDYEDCEDLKVIVTNTNEDEYGTVIYNDLSTTLIVAEDSELEFTEGNIPMESDAACLVTLYRSSSSSTVIGTKVYDSFKEALEALEEQDDVIEDYDISSAYEDTFVVKMKFGEKQTLTNFTFAPDYDTTISIDLNGYELKLKSEWIDYDDCDKLVVNVNNTNKDKKGTLTYSDLSISLAIAKGDTALKFQKDEIPGIYDVTISSVTNGKITASPSKNTVAHGGTVTFTITPNEGYEISGVKVGNKSVTATTAGYSVNSKGVATYKMENITADVTISATFKKAAPASAAANWNNPFTDVTKNAQYYEAVAFVCSEGLFNGMTATKFEPMTTMTRAMFVTVLGRLAGINEMFYTGTSFTDVSKYDQQISWAAPYIEWAVQVGITNGTGNGKFSPNDPITHQQMYVFMKRYAEVVENINTSVTGVSLTGIKDSSEIADWAEEGVKFASKNGILITSGGKLTPADNALRCELAMLLHGFCVKVLDHNG